MSKTSRLVASIKGIATAVETKVQEKIIKNMIESDRLDKEAQLAEISLKKAEAVKQMANPATREAALENLFTAFKNEKEIREHLQLHEQVNAYLSEEVELETPSK